MCDFDLGERALAGQVFEITAKGFASVNWRLFEDDFEFVFSEEHVCRVNCLMAEFLSPRISRIRRSDRVYVRYVFEGMEDTASECLRTFEAMVECAKSGRPLQLEGLRFRTLVGIARELENSELLSRLLSMADMSDLTMKKTLSLLPLCASLVRDDLEIFSKVFDFAASHFSEIHMDELADLGVGVVETILCNKNLQIDDEDSLYRTIRALMEKDLKFSGLLGCVFFEYLSEASIRDVTYFIGCYLLDGISGSVWLRIARRLLLTPTATPPESCESRDPTTIVDNVSRPVAQTEVSGLQRMDAPHSYVWQTTPPPSCEGDLFSIRIPFESNPLGGIIAHLTRDCGGNVHDMNIVACSSDDVYTQNPQYHAKYAADLGSNTYFKSNNRPNSWICYDFKDHRVSISSYTLRSARDGRDSLQSWSLEVSDDGQNWTKIDQRTKDTSLNGPMAMCRFEPTQARPKRMVRYVRLRQTGESRASDGTFYFSLSAFEIFGRFK